MLGISWDTEEGEIGYEFDITYYHAESLFKMADQVKACEQGLVDMTVAVLTYELNQAPLHEVLDFGFMGWDAHKLNRVWSDLDESIPEFKAELSPFVELFSFIPTQLFASQ